MADKKSCCCGCIRSKPDSTKAVKGEKKNKKSK